MSDTATWTCPKCSERVESERVVDETFIPRVKAHKATHIMDTDPTPSVPLHLLYADATLDHILDELCKRGKSVTDLARWDLKAAIQDTLTKVYAR